MKVMIMTDLEGVAGYVSFDYDHGSKTNEMGKRLLTGEVNAAVEGLLAGGATDILVFDGHGPGAIHYPDLHESAKLWHGRPAPPRSVWGEILARYHAALMIGQHAMAGAARGDLAHTQNSRAIESYTLNGRPIGEIAQWALFAGSFNVPLIFLAGDDAACAEARDLVPGLPTAAVKTGLSRNSAISLSHSAACRLIREGAETALEKHRAAPLAPVQWPAPYVLEKRFFHTDSVDALRDKPGVEIVDSLTVRIRSDHVRDIVYA
jgi:D-amino peptidase